MKCVLIRLAIVCLLASVAPPAVAKSLTVSVPMSAIDAISGERGPFYVVNVAVPEDVVGKRLDTVVLELAIDVTTPSLEDSAATPLVGVYPLARERTAGVGGEGAAAGIDPTAYNANVPSARPVALGENRVLRVDITDIVKGWMRDPSSNHGLVIGSLTGPAVGSISLKDNVVDSGAALRVTFFYQNRFGDRISTRQ